MKASWLFGQSARSLAPGSTAFDANAVALRATLDGRRIAFTSNRDGRYQIYIMNADGSGQRRVRDHVGRDDYAAWHPDERHLLVVSEHDGKSDVYRLEVPG